MELFLLLVPAVIVPLGLSIAGLWWLLSSDGEENYDENYDDVDDGGIG